MRNSASRIGQATHTQIKKTVYTIDSKIIHTNYLVNVYTIDNFEVSFFVGQKNYFLIFSFRLKGYGDQISPITCSDCTYIDN